MKISAAVICMTAGLLLFVGFSQEQPARPVDTMPQMNAPVTAVTIQLGRDTYGLAMIDANRQTLWIYEFSARGQTFDQIRLVAARSFEYDRQLTEWNTGSPTPTQVKNIIETIDAQQKQQQRKQEEKIEELQKLLEQN